MVLYLDTPEAHEVAGDAAVPFASQDDLTRKLQWALSLPPAGRTAWGRRALERIESRYSWEIVTDQYEALLCGLVKSKS